jgi:aspartate kinase
MRVFKFGGASIADAGRMAAILPIIREENEPVLLVLSALGKTTNALEKIVNSACKGDKQEAVRLVKDLEQQHLDYAHELLNDVQYKDAAIALKAHFAEMELAVNNVDPARYDYSYDQIVCMGELLSSHMFSYFLLQNNIANEWIDIRNVIRTDHTYRDGVVDWGYSKYNAEAILGFIGATDDGKSVTLGREGSDYTAAILAAMLQLESVTIWKDVEGLQNADPKLFPNTVKIDTISYGEVIEMAFYGAQIIHPKTIKPLQNSNIPLYVKCFLNPGLKGSVIQAEAEEMFYPPLIVLKSNQVLIQVTTKDFSFIAEDNLSKLYSIFHNLKIKINLIQNAAISFIACIDNREDKVKALLQALGMDYKVLVNENVSLLTVRHYTPEIIFELTKNKQIFLRQETRKTVQVIMK